MDDYGLASNSWSPSPLQRAAAKKSTTRTSLETVTFSTIDDKQLGSDSVQIASAANEGDGVIYTDDSEDCVLGQSDSEALPGCSGCRLKLGQHLPLSVLLDSSDGPHRRCPHSLPPTPPPPPLPIEHTSLLTESFGSTAKVLAKCKVGCYRISECCCPWMPAAADCTGISSCSSTESLACCCPGVTRLAHPCWTASWQWNDVRLGWPHCKQAKC